MDKTVILDKNSGSRKLQKACNDQTKKTGVRCILLPRKIRDVGDDRVIAEFAATKGFLTVTLDTTFIVETAHVFAGRNPGLILLREDHGSNRHMNSKTAIPFLERFKRAFPDWNAVPWMHSFVEMTPTTINVHHTLSALPVIVGRLSRSKPGWQEELRQLLQSNSVNKT